MKVAIGQDSHKFENDNTKKLCILGGVPFPETPGLKANSDGDVVLHAITNAVSGITCRNILGGVADKMCDEGIFDSVEYLKVALEDLDRLSYKISHLSISMECKRPMIMPRVNEMRESIANIMGINTSQVGLTATTGEGLTSFGKGEGIFVTCILTVE